MPLGAVGVGGAQVGSRGCSVRSQTPGAGSRRRAALEWRLVVGVARQYGRVGKDKDKDKEAHRCSRCSVFSPRPTGFGGRGCSPSSGPDSIRRRPARDENTNAKKVKSREYIFLYNGHSYEIDHMIGPWVRPFRCPQILLPACLLCQPGSLSCTGRTCKPATNRGPQPDPPLRTSPHAPVFIRILGTRRARWRGAQR